MRCLLIFFLFATNYLFSQPAEILKEACDKLEKLNKVEYRSTTYSFSMAGEWISDGRIFYENRNHYHLVILKNETDFPYKYLRSEERLKLNESLPQDFWIPNYFLDETISETNISNLESKIMANYPFGTDKEIVFNGKEFVGTKEKIKITSIESNLSFLRSRTHLIILDLLKGIEKEGTIISFTEKADTYKLTLKARWPKGTLLSDQVKFQQAIKIDLLLDKKELVPLVATLKDKWGFALYRWDDYKYEVSIDEKIWEINENTHSEEEKLLFYEDENGVIDDYQISSKKVFYKGTEVVNCDPKKFQHLGQDYFSDSLKIFYAGKIVPDVDLETFRIVNGSAIDKNNIYSGTKIIVGGVPDSLNQSNFNKKITVFNRIYLKEGNKIYGKHGKLVSSADAESFELLEPTNGLNSSFTRCWARDKNHVYYYNDIIEVADPKTIVLLTQNHARDKDHYFLNQQVFKNDGTFVIFPNLMSKNNQGVYLQNGKKLVDVDPASFRYLNRFYQKDKDQVFFENKKLLKADPTTFEAVGAERYGFDKNFVFFRQDSIPLADPATWQWLAAFYSKDHQNVFFYRKKIEGADASTFKIKDIGKRKIGEDKNGKYLNGRLTDEATILKKLKK